MTPAKPTPEPAIQRMLSAITLDSLRGFEAAARLGSFTAAAEELYLTQSAISKQVKALEEVLGCAVFVRGARELKLTQAGDLLHRDVQAVLTQLRHTLSRLSVPTRHCVSITLPPSLASLWLTPRLAAFHAEAPEIDLRIHAAEEQLPLDRHGLDLALRMGTAPDALLTETLQLVAAPALARRIQQPDDLLKLPWLAFEHGVRRHAGMDWSHWLTHLGLRADPQQALHHFSQYEHLLKAACEGLGIGIGRRPLVDGLIAQGQLVVVLPTHQLPGLTYQLVYADQTSQRPHVAQFVQWLMRQIETTQAMHQP